MMRSFKVVSPDGVAISAQSSGNPEGIPVVFIHGFSQSRLSWLRQTGDPGLARLLHMVAYDLRGHGDSDRPDREDAYQAGRLWADDLAAVISAAGMTRPYLVGWSYGGRVIADYLATYGSDGIAGINYVNARCSTDPALFGSAQKHLTGMRSDDIAVNREATRAFLRSCFEVQPAPEDFEAMVAFNMKVSPSVRRTILARRNEAPEVLAGLACPVLATHGLRDDIILPAMSRYIAATVKGARLSLYEGIGHSPFWEDPSRFNAELAAFVGAEDPSRRSAHG